jgi:hypothetical protein
MNTALLVKRGRILAQAVVRQTFAGFYFFHQYNAPLVATQVALVHRFLTYLSRVCKSRLSKSPSRFSRVFRLATMFYAPVNLSARFNGSLLLPALTLGNYSVRHAGFDSAFGFY